MVKPFKIRASVRFYTPPDGSKLLQGIHQVSLGNAVHQPPDMNHH